MAAMRFILLCILLLSPLLAQRKTLDIYFIDVEGGQTTLVVTPAGKSMLIDTGWPTNDGRDANRVVAAMKQAGVTELDVLIVTHYHIDHVGGVAEIAARIPVKEFIDHGPNNETGPQAEKLYDTYLKAIGKSKRRTVRPGEKIPLAGVEVNVVCSNGDIAAKPQKGAGQPNPLCAAAQQKAPDATENARSIGVIIKFGDFRFIDLGDVTWNKELEMVCPNNKLGTVDLYLTTHHGMDLSGPAALVHAIRPKVAVMNNGSRKGASPSAWQIVSESPGLEDLWQLHRAVAPNAKNVADERIANPGPDDPGHPIIVSAEKSGAFRVTNARNGHTKQYR